MNTLYVVRNKYIQLYNYGFPCDNPPHIIMAISLFVVLDKLYHLKVG